jgi:hypothetical protein
MASGSLGCAGGASVRQLSLSRIETIRYARYMSADTLDISAEITRVRNSVSEAEFRALVRVMHAKGYSIRDIAALTGQHRSRVERALKAPLPDPTEMWKEVATPILYDIFFETGTALTAYYIDRRRRAEKAEEKQVWFSRLMALQNARHDVDPEDRATMIKMTEKWRAEIKHLKSLINTNGHECPSTQSA